MECGALVKLDLTWLYRELPLRRASSWCLSLRVHPYPSRLTKKFSNNYVFLSIDCKLGCVLWESPGVKISNLELPCEWWWPYEGLVGMKIAETQRKYWRFRWRIGSNTYQVPLPLFVADCYDLLWVWKSPKYRQWSRDDGHEINKRGGENFNVPIEACGNELRQRKWHEHFDYTTVPTIWNSCYRLVVSF